MTETDPAQSSPQATDDDGPQSADACCGLPLNIGALAQATGVPVPTLRTWERRYGFPCPRRSAGGHRLYDPETVERVRLIARALSRGLRPAQVVPAADDDLRALLGEGATAPTSAPADVTLHEWLDAARRLDGDRLDAAFRLSEAHLGLQGFICDRAGPFLVALGESWESGAIEVYQEHFASERLREFLVSRWRPLADRAPGPWAVFAGLPGERHVLGLHLAASVVALWGWRVLFLGDDTPVADIARCAADRGARAVLITVSSTQDLARAGTDLAELAAAMPLGVDLVVGGAGAPDALPGARHLTHLCELADWARTAAA